MYRRLLSVTVVALLAFTLAACHNKRVSNPIANVDSKQPDKVLFDRAMDFLKHNRYDQARLTLETLLNTYPDSEYIARAKLGVADSWYAEGGTAAWAQAEAQYNDFRTFFPNMPEAAEAQMKIGNIHYQQMEKADRDFTHAKKAEDAYREMILEYPDSKLLPQAKERLRQVQEVLAEREFDIGRFYYLRQSYVAAIARLKSLTDTYPLYSDADEALYMIGDSYEGQIRLVRENRAMNEAMKGKFIKEWQDNAAQAYSKIITRYPVSPRAEDARKHLAELKKPIPTPTPEAIAQNKAEEESREKLGLWSRAMLNFHRRPDMAEAAGVGEPTLVDPKQTDAPTMMRHVNDMILGGNTAAPSGTVNVEAGTGPIGPNQAPPRSDKPAAQPQGDTPAAQPATPSSTPSDSTATPDQSPAATGIGELTPMNSAPGTTATQTTPQQANPAATEPTGTATAPAATQGGVSAPSDGAAATSNAPATPPPQVNEINNNGAASGNTNSAAAGTSSSKDQSSDDSKDKKESSSKKKKKKFKIF
jgi:outer membrane protein assembly factor BamD